MQNGEFCDDEIRTAKNTILSGMRQINDSPSALEAFSFRRLLAGVCEELDDAAKAIERVTREDIIAAAKKVKIDTVYFLSGDCEEEYDDE